MTRKERWQGIGCVWFVFAVFALGWTYVAAPVIREARWNSHSNPSAERRAADAAASSASFEAHRKNTPPTEVLLVPPGAFSDWIDLNGERSNQKFTWKFDYPGPEQLTGSMFAEYDGGNVKKMPIILPDDYEWKRPNRLRVQNTGSKPLRVRVWFFD